MRLKRSFKEKKRGAIALALLGVTILILCQLAFSGSFRSATQSVESFNRVATKHLGPLKEKSLEKGNPHQIGSENATEFALARTLLVMAGEIPLENLRLTIGRKRSGSPEPSDSKPKGKNRPNITNGTATAITSDGYWLTAAHLTELAHVYLASVGEAEGPPYEVRELHPARVVWTREKGDPSAPDLSLIYCSHLPARHFPLLRPPILSPDAEVLTAGYGVSKLSLSAGRILRRGPNKGTQSGPRWMVYLSGAPVIPGDSGGPLLTAEGQLLGGQRQRAV